MSFLRYIENLMRLVRNIFYVKILFLIIGKKQQRKKHYVSLCLIFKNEAKFLREWIEYYLILGVDHFYLYNNNSTDDYQKVLKPYINQGIVTLTEWPELPGQMSSYNHCIEKFSSETNWIGFIDADEFICPLQYENIPEWLTKYQKLPSVFIFWKMFGSNGIIHEDEERPIIEQFTVCGDMIRSAKVFLNTDWSHRVKNFRMPHAIHFKGLGTVVQKHAHLLFSLVKSVKNDEKIDIQMNHYYVKSYDHYVRTKATRGDVLKNHENIYKLQRFFEVEEQAYRSDYHIFKYLVKVKLALKDKS